jgi:hypothetical protein
MASSVDNAVGTERQFRTQPRSTYQEQLVNPSFGNGITKRDDLGAASLANSLGALGDAIWNESVHEYRRKEEQFTTDMADRLIAGKSPEDLQKLDRLTLLQGADSPYDLTDNPVAMAVLDKSIGQVAGVKAKQDYDASNANVIPKSPQDAVASYENFANSTYDKYKGTIRNTAAFDKGFYGTFLKDTLNVAEDARKRIDEEARQTGMATSNAAMSALCYNKDGMTQQAVLDSFQTILNKNKLAVHNPEEARKLAYNYINEFSKRCHDTDSLLKIGEMEFYPGHKIKDEIPMTDAFVNVAKQVTGDAYEDAKNKFTKPDGTIDLVAADKYLTELESKAKLSNSAIPGVDMPVNGDNVQVEVDRLNAPFKRALPFIGGLLQRQGVPQMIITSGGRNYVLGGSGTGSYHMRNDAIDIDVGIHDDSGKALENIFKPYFKEVMWETPDSTNAAGQSISTGYHLHLGGYNGNLNGSSGVDKYASSYNPDFHKNVMAKLMAANRDAEALIREKKAQQREEFESQLNKTTNQSEELDLINNADFLTLNEKRRYINASNRWYQRSTAAGVGADEKAAMRYVKTKGYDKDVEVLKSYNAAVDNGDDVGDIDNPKSLFYKAEQASGRIRQSMNILGSGFKDSVAADNNDSYVYSSLWKVVTSEIAKGTPRSQVEAMIRQVAPGRGVNPDNFIKNIDWDDIEVKK